MNSGERKMNTVLDMLNQIIGGLLIAGIVWFAIKFVVERGKMTIHISSGRSLNLQRKRQV